MKRNFFALCALLLFAHSILAQDTRLQQPASEFTYSTAVVSIDSRGEIGGDFTNGFFPNERLDVVWIDEPSYGTVQYNSESQLVFYQPSADNLNQLDEFTVYATDTEGAWNITRFFFDPTSKELVFSTAVSEAAYEGASLGHFGRASFCSWARPTARDGFTQFWGGVKLVTGILETAGGVAVGVGTSWTGVGAVAGVGIAAHGVDTLQSGFRQLWSGEEIRTGTSYLGAGTAHHIFGVESDRSVVIGELFDAAIGIASGVGTISKGPQVVDKFGDVFRLSANVRLVPAVGRGLDETIDISADVTKLVKLSGATTAGVYSGRGGDELQQLFSQVPDEFGKASNRTAFDSAFYRNQYAKFSKKSDLIDADDFVRSDGVVLTAHPAKHSISKATQLDVLNNWERSWTGINYNGRPVDVYWKGDVAVITQRGAKNKIITAYDSQPHTRWSDRSNWRTSFAEEVYKAFRRNNQR